MKPPVTVTLQIPADVWAAYQRTAKRERTTPETIVRQIIRDAAEQPNREAA